MRSILASVVNRLLKKHSILDPKSSSTRTLQKGLQVPDVLSSARLLFGLRVARTGFEGFGYTA